MQTNGLSDTPVLVSGVAGFVGYHVASRLLSLGCRVYGFDDFNPYYDVALKESRFALLSRMTGFHGFRVDLADNNALRGVFEQAPIGIAIVKDKNFIYQSQSDFMNINPTFEQILGRKGDVLNQTKWTEITHPDDLQADLEKFKEFKNGSIGGYTMEKRFLRPDGSSVWTNMKISALSGFFSENFMHLCLVEDITARRQTEDLLRENERRQEVFFSRLPGLAYRCKYDRDGTMLLVSDGCGELTGYPPESFINNRDLAFNSIIDPKYRTLLWQEWQRTVPKRQSYKCEYEITTSDGEKKWVLELGQGVYKDDGEVEALEGIILDISDRKEMENRLRYINEHDAWTGLHNLDYLQKLLAHDAGHAAMPARALISINLSTVQLITANYGFHYTQTLMKKAAETLEPYSSANRMLFKTYENRFVFYMKEYRDLNELLQFAEEIAGSLEELFLSERIGGGIGILEINKDSEADVDLLLKRLLIASEMAINIYEKEFRVCVYDKDVEAQVNRDLEIRQELTRIASEDSCGELFLQYQPILNLKTNKVCSFEALARLRTEKLGWVPPLEFIPVAEKTKLIIPIGDKIIFKALSFLRKLKEQGYENTGVSINISAFQLIKPGFADGFEEMIREMQVNPENIGIEITESVFTSDYDNMNRLIRKLREAGLHVAIDDFGTGYSSLAREKELQVNCLKIDKYFIDKLLVDGNDKAITGHIISMAHKLGHCTVAEGVECEAQKQYLLDNGCDKIQGYLVSGPLDEEAAIELLRRQEDFRIR